MIAVRQAPALDAQEPPERELTGLGLALGRSGLADYVGCFDTLAPRRGDWARHRDRAPDRLWPLIDLCLLGRAVRLDALSGAVQEQLADAEAAGLLCCAGREVAMLGGLAIVPVFGRWLLCNAPWAGQHFYFGDDTLALLSRMMPKPGGRCLDLCAGPGMLALHAAGIADQVVAVEMLADPARLAYLNSHLNALSHRIEIRQGDLYLPIVGEVFDTVVANPPMLPMPAMFEYARLGHAGEDGLTVTRRLLAGLRGVLHADGTAQIIGTMLSDGSEPLALDSLRDVAGAGLDLTVSIYSHRSLTGDPLYFDAIVAAALAEMGTGADAHESEVRSGYLAMLTRYGASALCHVLIHARHGEGRFDRIDVSGTNRGLGWRWQR